MNEQDLALVRRVYEAFAGGDVATIMGSFAADGVVYQSPALPWGGTHRGHEGLGHFLTTLVTHLESVPRTERLVADGAGHVVQVGATVGRVRATGVPSRSPRCTSGRFARGW